MFFKGWVFVIEKGVIYVQFVFKLELGLDFVQDIELDFELDCELIINMDNNLV